ncbi:MAG: hypothetical protein U0228_26220 [Myxococcaceae bacterium]
MHGLAAASLLCAVLSACSATPSVDAGVDAGDGLDASVFVPTHQRLLGLNDVTFLLPLELLDAGTPFPPAVTMVPLSVFSRLTEAMPVVRTEPSRLRVLGVRFDLCDRSDGAPCQADRDGVLRLVLQPVFGEPANVEDMTLHAFFPVPRAEVPELVDTLRGLAELQDVPRTAPLQVTTAFSTSPAFRAGLGALVARYAHAAQMFRMTLFGQETEHAAIVWAFRGEEMQNGQFAPITIPGIAMTSQEVLLFGGDSYMVTPLVDEPAGFARVVMETSFRNSTPAQQLESVRSLLIADNPLSQTASTEQCVTCHVATNVLAVRAADAGIDLGALTERYTAPGFDLSVPPSNLRTRTLRALGYFGSFPILSQRVVNETAHVVEEMEQRLPPP